MLEYVFLTDQGQALAAFHLVGRQKIGSLQLQELRERIENREQRIENRREGLNILGEG